jgi:hypothetical protein
MYRTNIMNEKSVDGSQLRVTKEWRALKEIKQMK